MDKSSIFSANKLIVFYDGDCGFCNHWVQWILKNDKEDKFLFSSLQSDFGQEFLSERGLKTDDFDTLYLWNPKQFYLTKYQAILKIVSELGSVYKLSALGKLIPNSIGNKIYNWIAKRRKKLNKNFCLILDNHQAQKFIK